MLYLFVEYSTMGARKFHCICMDCSDACGSDGWAMNTFCYWNGAGSSCIDMGHGQYGKCDAQYSGFFEPFTQGIWIDADNAEGCQWVPFIVNSIHCAHFLLC